MAWGLGNFLTDMVGQSNIDAAKKAYNNSRFKETVDDVSEFAGNTADSVAQEYKYQSRMADEREAARAANQQRAEEVAFAKMNPGLNLNVNDPRYQALKAANPSMQDTTLDAVGGLGALRAAPVVGNKLKRLIPDRSTKVVHPGNKTIQFEKRKLQPMVSDDLGDIAYKTANAKTNKYGQDMTRAQMSFDDAAREVAIQQGMRNAATSAATRAANKQIPSSAWDAINSSKMADDIARDIAFRKGAEKELARRMNPNHPNGLI